jgi:hypothetical protein
MEDSPPPEGDPKLKDRLQDYHGDADQDPAKLTPLHSKYDTASPSVKKWATSFGLKDDSLPEGAPVSLLMTVEPGLKAKRDEVLELAQRQVQQVLAFKQAQYEARKQRVRESLDKENSQQMNKTQDMGAAASQANDQTA